MCNNVIIRIQIPNAAIMIHSSREIVIVKELTMLIRLINKEYLILAYNYAKKNVFNRNIIRFLLYRIIMWNEKFNCSRDSEKCV